MNNDIFERAPLKKAYVTLVVPVVLSMLVTLVYNIMDTYFIARTGDTNIVAGVSLCAPLFLLLIALGDLFGIGGSTLVARLFGGRQDEDGTRVSAFSFYAAFFAGVVVAIVLLAFRGAFLPLLGANEETYAHASQYFSIIAVGSPFIMISYIPANMLRTEGFAKEGMYGTVIGAVVNIILDPIMISAMGMGAKGAALATVIANICTDLFFIQFMLRREMRISMDIRKIRISPKYILMIIAVGVPACITNVLSSFAQTITNRFLLPYGNTSIAAMGIALKLSMCATMIFVGMSFGAQPMIAFNFGAKNKERLREIIRYCLRTQLFFTVLIAAVLFVFANPLIRLFMSNEAVLQYGPVMLRLLMVGSVMMSVTVLINSICQAFGKNVSALLLSTGRQGYVFIPIMIVAANLFGYYGVISAQMISEVICLVIALVIYFRIIKKELA